MDNQVTFIEYDHHEALVSSHHVIEKLFQLLAMFHSSRTIAKSALKDAVAHFKSSGGPQYCTHPQERLRNELFHSQATKLLIETAIYMRILDDRFHGEYPLEIDFTCGTLVDKEINKTPLTLREACNKIIHATSFDFTHEELADSRRYRGHGFPIFFHSPTISFYGQQGKKDWMAIVEVERFCEVATKSAE
jgi:hypothetical protein